MKTSYEVNKTWRRRHPDARHAQKLVYRQRTGSYNAPNLGTRWTPDEDELVLLHEIPDRDLAELMGRSVQAISVRRHRLLTRDGC